jgi:hypothetical protein
MSFRPNQGGGAVAAAGKHKLFIFENHRKISKMIESLRDDFRKYPKMIDCSSFKQHNH